MTTPYATSNTADVLTEVQPTARNVIGWLLIGSAFAFSLVASLRIDNAFAAGQQVGRLVGYALVFALLAWLITRTRSLSAKANGRIVVGVLLLLAALGNFSVLAEEKKVGQTFLRDAIALNAVHTQKFQALNERFAAVDLTDLLTAKSMTSAADIATARDKVGQFKLLIVARDALLHENLDSVRLLVANLPEGMIKSDAHKAIGKKRKGTVRVFSELSRAQLAQMQVIDLLLDWSAAQQGKLTSNNGQLAYTSAQQGTELQALLDQLSAAEKVSDLAFEAASRVEKKAEEKRVEGMKLAKDLLK
ncbi:MAG: hypothetical protein WKG03_11055 [Telluria sp.]